MPTTQTVDWSQVQTVTHNGATVEKVDIVHSPLVRTFDVTVRQSIDAVGGGWTNSGGGAQNIYLLDDDWWPSSASGSYRSGYVDAEPSTDPNAGFGDSNIDLELLKGCTYVFDQSDSSNSGHPLGFVSSGAGGSGASVVRSGTLNGCTITNLGTPGQSGAETRIVIPANYSGSSIYWACNAHANMGGYAPATTTAPIELWRRVWISDSVETQQYIPPVYGWVSQPTGNVTNNVATYYWHVNCEPRPANLWPSGQPSSADCPTGWQYQCQWTNVGGCPWTCNLQCIEYTTVWGIVTAGYYQTTTTDTSRYLYFF